MAYVTFNRQHRRWQYARGIPKDLRPLFGGKVHFPRAYLNAPRENTPKAERKAIILSEPLAQRDDANLAKVEALSDSGRSYVIEIGGFDMLARHLSELSDQARASDRIRAIADSINHRVPLPNASIVVGDERRTPSRSRGGEQAVREVSPEGYILGGTIGDADRGKAPIVFAEGFGGPRVLLPKAPTSWAELRADLGDWGRDLAHGVNSKMVQAQAILLKAQPSGEFSFDGLLDVWVRHQGPHWRGRKDNHERTARELQKVLGNIDYRDVRQEEEAVKFRDKLETGGGHSWQTKHLERASAMYAAAVSEGAMRGKPNPFSGITVRGTAADADEDQTDLFTASQMKEILKKAAAIRWGDRRIAKRHSEAMWLLKVMAYSGMRPNEVLQLQRGDVYVEPESGLKVMHIRRTCCVTGKRHDEKSMKNPKLRDVYVPLHPKLAEFFEFAKGGDDAEFIFAAFPYKDAAKKRRAWFDTNFAGLLKECKIEPKPGRKLSLYSIRRLFHRACDNSGMPKYLKDVVTSHAPQDVCDAYSRGADLKLLAAAVARVQPI